MKTTRLYQQDRYIKEWDAQVTSVTEDNGSLIVTLDKSAFFPEGGGQSCDLGMMGGYEVIDVQEKDEEVYHKVKPAEGENSADGKPAPLQEGDAVHCVLDWDRRFDNMQRHCGEHILSGIFFALFGGVNRGFLRDCRST